MKVYGAVDVQIHVFLTSALVEVSDQLHGANVLLLQKQHPAPTGQGAGWAPKPVWTIRRSENS
jgi:hypothetical protein